MQEFADGTLGRHGSQSIQCGKTGFASVIEQLRDAFALCRIERRDKPFPETLLRTIPDAADKSFKHARARQQHLIDDQPGRGTLDKGAGVIVSTPAQRIKPTGQAKPGRPIVGEFREAITITDQYDMPFALTPKVKIALKGRMLLQIKLAD